MDEAGVVVYNAEYPAGRYPPDPYNDERPTEGWFADKMFGERRWETFVALSDGWTSRRVQDELGYDRRSVTAWVKLWRQWWPGCMPNYGAGNPDVIADRHAVVAALADTARALGAFESVPGRSLAAAGVEAAAIFVEWAQGLDADQVAQLQPRDVAALGATSARMMKTAFELEDRLTETRQRNVPRSTVTNNLLVNIEADGAKDTSSAEKLGALLTAYQNHGDKKQPGPPRF